MKVKTVAIQLFLRHALVPVKDLCVNLCCLCIDVFRQHADCINWRFEAQEAYSVRGSRCVKGTFLSIPAAFTQVKI